MDLTEIAANDDNFIPTCAAVEVIKSTYQSFLPGESCETNNAESHEWSGYYWITNGRVYCGSSCEDIYNNNSESHDRSGYYWILDGPSRAVE